MRLRAVLKSKVDRLKVTQTELYYQGSIGIDKAFLSASDIVAGEKVQVLNYNNGKRIETYVIEKREGSGIVALYGPAAKCGSIGDQICVLSYFLVDDKELAEIKPQIVLADENNKIAK